MPRHHPTENTNLIAIHEQDLMANWELLNTTEYGTLVWPDDIDIAPEDVWERCVRDPVPLPNGADSDLAASCVAEAPAEYDAEAKPDASPSSDAPATP